MSAIIIKIYQYKNLIHSFSLQNKIFKRKLLDSFKDHHKILGVSEILFDSIFQKLPNIGDDTTFSQKPVYLIFH